MAESTVVLEFSEEATQLLSSIYAHLTTIAKTLADHEQRLRSLERYSPTLIG